MKRSSTALILLVTAVALPVASQEDESTSLSYISYMERYATVQPANQAESIEAVINLPLVAGDRIDTAREARVEVVMADGSLLWLDEYTTVSFDSVAFSRDSSGDRTVLFLAEGRAMIEIPETRLGTNPTRISSGRDVMHLNEPGLYRLEALPAGGLRIEVWGGVAEASTEAGGVLLHADQSTELSAGQVSRVEEYRTDSDAFAQWVDRRRQWAGGESGLHVDERYSRQAATLDNYGDWIYLESEGSWAWQPSVGAGWSPYTAGRWHWTPSGWSWVSYEPWGWLPYHYGSWNYTVSVGWAWSWGSCWSPAWVHWMHWPGYVGWCPAGYYNRWCYNNYYPYWGHYPGHHPGGGGGSGGGGAYRPGRRDVVPHEASGRVAVPRDGGAVSPTEMSLDLNGRARVGAVDRRGWNVVASRDFASPHVARLVKPAEVAFRGHEESQAVFRSGSLRTDMPGRMDPARGIENAFAGSSSRSGPDLTPVLARDASMSASEAARLARPTSTAEMSRRSVQALDSVSEKPSPTNHADQSLSYDSDIGSGSSVSRTAPNIYRPVLGSSAHTTPSRVGRRSTLGQRELVMPTGGSLRGGAQQPSSSPSTSSASRPQQVPASSSAGTSTGSRSMTRSTVRPGMVRPPVSTSSTSRSSTTPTTSSRPMVAPRSSSGPATYRSGSTPSTSAARVRPTTSRSPMTVRPSSSSRSRSPGRSSTTRSTTSRSGSSSRSYTSPSRSSSSRGSSSGSSSRSSSSSSRSSTTSSSSAKKR